MRIRQYTLLAITGLITMGLSGTAFAGHDFHASKHRAEIRGHRSEHHQAGHRHQNYHERNNAEHGLIHAFVPRGGLFDYIYHSQKSVNHNGFHANERYRHGSEHHARRHRETDRHRYGSYGYNTYGRFINY